MSIDVLDRGGRVEAGASEFEAISANFEFKPIPDTTPNFSQVPLDVLSREAQIQAEDTMVESLEVPVARLIAFGSNLDIYRQRAADSSANIAN